MSAAELGNQPVFDSIDRAQRSAQSLRDTVVHAIDTYYQHPNHELLGDFPVVFNEVAVEHADDAEPLLPSIPMIVACSPGTPAGVVDKIQMIQPANSLRRYISFTIETGEYGYLHPIGSEGETSVRFNIMNMGIPLSNMQAIREQQSQGIPVSDIHALGVHFFMYHAQNERMLMDAVFFPITLLPEHFDAFDNHDRAWTAQILEKKREDLLVLHETNAPILIDTEHTPRILREWQRNRQDVFGGLVYALASESDALKQSEVIITPTRELSWGKHQQIKGNVTRIAYWNHGPVVTEMQFTLKDVSAAGLQAMQLQKARNNQDALRISLSLGISGDTVAMHMSHTGAYDQNDVHITNPEQQDFWIRVLSSMNIHTVKHHSQLTRARK